jgi:hypothetical protein
MTTSINISSISALLASASGSGASSADIALVTKAEALIQEIMSQPGGKATSSENSQLEQVVQQLKDAMTDSGKSAAGAGSASGESWLEAVAAALAKQLTNLANKMQTDANNVNSSDTSTSQAADADLQASAQEYGTLANALSTVLQSIGKGDQAITQA